MGQFEAWTTFRKGFREVTFHLRLAIKAEEDPLGVHPSSALLDRDVYSRAAVVITAGILERFFIELAEDFLDDVEGSWNAQHPAAKRMLALAVSRELRALEEDLVSPHKLGQEGQPDEYRKGVVQLARVFTKPRFYNSAFARPVLEGYYKQRGASSIDRLMSSLRPDLAKFFSWLESEKECDRSEYWTSVEGLINARNEIAHGNSGFEVTATDAMRYSCNARSLAVHAVAYLKHGA